MDKERNKFCEKNRIIIAKQLDMPPDDIDMSAILDCVERAIEKSCEKESGEVIIRAEGKEEKEGIVSDSGSHIINLIFTNEYPFVDYVSDYAEWYASKFLKNIYRKRNMEE